MKLYLRLLPGVRYELRQPPLWMELNIWEGKCWCGKPKKLFEPLQRKYCTGKHANLWFYSIRCYWDAFRHQVFERDKGKCTECGVKIMSALNQDLMYEVDHIHAISLGGSCFDLENVRTLCRKCHNKKTTVDIRKLKLQKNKQQVLVPL